MDYLYVRKLLEKWTGVPIGKIAERLNSEDWAVTTYNRRVYYLRDFFSWLVGQGVISLNPLAEVRGKREKKRKKNSRREPLNEEEIERLLDAVKNNTFCHKAARPQHSYYYPFLKFMFITGVRNAEAIGLRVKYMGLSINDQMFEKRI